jgi:hypothetical protein
MTRASFTLLTLIFPLLAHAGNSLCANDEDALFSCPIGSKVLSVCASRDLSASSGYVQYRFGNKDRPELIFPQARVHPAKYFAYGELSYSSGGGFYLRFNNAGSFYTVYSAEARSYSGGADTIKAWESAGVVVEGEGKVRSHLKCRLPRSSQGGLELTVNEEKIRNAKVPEDNSAFRLP